MQTIAQKAEKNTKKESIVNRIIKITWQENFGTYKKSY